MLRLGLTRFLPDPLGDHIRGIVAALAERRPPLKLKPRPIKIFNGASVAVAGFFSTRCGLQRAADIMVEDFAARGVRVVRCDVSKLLGVKCNLTRGDVLSVDELVATDVTDIIMHVPAPSAAGFLNALGQQFYERTTLVAFWHWETLRIPMSWLPVAKLADEIWLPTPFVRSAFDHFGDRIAAPLKVVPHALRADAFKPTSAEERMQSRERLGLKADAFVAGFTFSMGSSFFRKNPIAALDAFKVAFSDEVRPVAFLLRCHDASSYPRGWKMLRKRASEDGRILLLDAPDKDVSIQEFYAAIDTLVSLHRSEGFGLPIAEAVQRGARVIATDWGLAPELVNLTGVRLVASRTTPLIDPQGIYAPGARLVWAEPDVRMAAEILVRDANEKFISVVDQQPETRDASLNG